MKKFFVVTLTIVALVAAGGWYLWQNRAAPTSLFDADPGYYTIGTINARIKVPDTWMYSSDADQAFAAFQSPDFANADGSKDPFSSSPVVSGAVIIIPLFLFEENEPLPVGVAVTLDGQEGDIAHGEAFFEEENTTTQFDRLRLDVDGTRYVLIAVEYPSNFTGAQAILAAAVASFKFK